jgi:hypothetical protein
MCTFDRYPEYDILADPDVAKTAAVSTRYSDSSLNGIILDIHFLSLSDYLVCTFSSQVSAVMYITTPFGYLQFFCVLQDQYLQLDIKWLFGS